jgi:hypothetical protein
VLLAVELSAVENGIITPMLVRVDSDGGISKGESASDVTSPCSSLSVPPILLVNTALFLRSVSSLPQRSSLQSRDLALCPPVQSTLTLDRRVGPPPPLSSNDTGPCLKSLLDNDECERTTLPG